MGGATGHIFSDVIGNRPAFGQADRYFWASDEHILYRDTGAAWVKVAVADFPDLDSIPASFPPSAHSHLTVAETEVFDGTSPTTWTDLDLSGTVGSNATLVLLKVYYPKGSQYLAVRKNGDTDVFAYTTYEDYAGGSAMVAGAVQNVHKVVIVATDDAGKIEWITDYAQAGTTIDIIAYIK